MRTLYMLTDGSGYVAYKSDTKEYVARLVTWPHNAPRPKVAAECYETDLDAACGSLHAMHDEITAYLEPATAWAKGEEVRH